jgi:hypothetical protein
MFGLPQETVTKIVQVSLPLMARKAESNPVLLKRLYAASQSKMPEPIQDFYVRMVESRALRQAAMDDYRATFGTMLDAVHREAGRQAGTTDGQAREVLAAMLPALNRALGDTNVAESEAIFAQRLHDLRE